MVGLDHKLSLIAFYLPQYHPIPENDKWWGKGFTEWTNVTKAKPLYKGHVQPKLPADLGYYDLRLPEVRQAQADLAQKYGLSAFCYWHYWFGNGKRMLDRPFNEVLKSSKPDFPFCLSWANQTWTGHWHGQGKEVLIEQKYGGIKDYESHFYEVLPSFSDKRYVKVEGKPLFLVYNPWDIPDPKEFTDCWRNLARKNGLVGIYFLAMDHHGNIDKYGMDASTWHEPVSYQYFPERYYKRWARKIGIRENPKRIEYADFVKYTLNKKLAEYQYPIVVPNWDNTPRSQHNGLVFENSNPELFRKHLSKAIKLVEDRKSEQKLIFIKSWNEWAEGNYLEPDQQYGDAYLQVIKELMF